MRVNSAEERGAVKPRSALVLDLLRAAVGEQNESVLSLIRTRIRTVGPPLLAVRKMLASMPCSDPASAAAKIFINQDLEGDGMRNRRMALQQAWCKPGGRENLWPVDRLGGRSAKKV